MTESGQLDAEAKLRVKQALREQAAKELATLRGTESTEATAVPIAADAAHSVDDLSQSDAEGELTGLLSGDVERQQLLLQQIDQLDVAPTGVVAPGAIVAYGGDRYLVGVVTDGFDCDGVSYLGIATDAPVYPKLVGLRQGDTFSYNDITFRLDLVT